MDLVQYISSNRLDQCLPVRLPEACYRFIESFLPESRHFRRRTEIREPLRVRGETGIFIMSPGKAQCFFRLFQMIQYILDDLLHFAALQKLRNQEDITEAAENLFYLAMSLLIKDRLRALGEGEQKI